MLQAPYLYLPVLNLALADPITMSWLIEEARAVVGADNGRGITRAVAAGIPTLRANVHGSGRGGQYECEELHRSAAAKMHS